MPAREDNDLLKPLEELGKPFKAKIKDITIVKASEIFGDKAILPDKQFLQFTLDTTQDKVRIALPTGLEYKNDTYNIVDMISYTRSINNPASYFRRFLEKYGKPPTKEMEIEIRITQRGFLELVL